MADHCGENVRLGASGAVGRLTDGRFNRSCAHRRTEQQRACVILIAIGAVVRSGACDDQSYLNEWWRSDLTACGEDLEGVADAAVSCVDAEQDRERLTRLVSAGGREAR